MRKVISAIFILLFSITSNLNPASIALAVESRTAPNLVSVNVSLDGSQISLSYDVSLYESAAPTPNKFVVQVDEEERYISQVTIDSNLVILSLSRAILVNQPVSLEYIANEIPDDTIDNAAIQDTNGIDAAALMNQIVNNLSTRTEKVVNPFGGKFAAIGRLAGYANYYSVLPGETLQLKIRSSQKYSIKIIRISSRAKNIGVQIPLLNWESAYPAAVQKSCAVKKTKGTVSCNWSTTASVPTGDLDTGLYVARLESSSRFHIIPFVVRSNPSQKTTAFVMSWMSLMAYNRFGGYSAYEIGTTHKSASLLSANRPLDQFGFGIFTKFEVPSAVAVDRNVTNATFTTDMDIDLGKSNPANYTSVVTGGHSEYWSLNLRRKIEKQVDLGMNLFIVGANTMYRRVQIDTSSGSNGRNLHILKSTLYKKIKTSTDKNYRFRDWPKSWPETKLMAIGYQYYYHRCGSTPNSWKVVDASWWGYKNTGVKNRQTIPALVGTEVDQILYGYQIPSTTQLVAHATYSCRTSGIKRSANHDAAYVTTRNGGAIFATGTQKWACAMNGLCRDRGFTNASNRFALTVTDNIITAFNQGPAGKQANHAAKFNVEKFYRSSTYKKFSR